MTAQLGNVDDRAVVERYVEEPNVRCVEVRQCAKTLELRKEPKGAQLTIQ